jgi:predicted GIY-YIG superfamily endonuclease
MTNRKLRSDRNHVIYRITASTGDFYIGVTVAQKRAFVKSVKTRLQKHFSAAKCDGKQWAFAEFIRNNPDVEYTYEVLEVVRGRKAAHTRERQLIALHKPTLNTK